MSFSHRYDGDYGVSYTFADGGELSGFRDPFAENARADVSHAVTALLQS